MNPSYPAPSRAFYVIPAMFVIAAVLLMWSGQVEGQQQRQFTYEQITVSSAAVAIAAATLDNMQACQLRVETNNVRYRQDGTAPTAAIGMPVNAGDALTFVSIADAKQARFIRQTSDAVLNVACWTSR
jgi:hypothetical protein